MILNGNMRKKRRELDLTQKEVAKRCVITQSYYAQIERGKIAPSFGILESIARALGLSAGEIWEVQP